MEGAVAGFDSRSLGPGELAQRVVPRLVRKIGVEPVEDFDEPLFEYDLVVAVALGFESFRRNVGAVLSVPAEVRQPFEGGLFEFGFGEGGHFAPSTTTS